MINPTNADSITISILQSPNESKGVEFKPTFSWPQTRDEFQKNPKAQEVAMTILGMSNGLNPGRIILGVEFNKDTKRYEGKGMVEEHLAKFDHDLIFNQIRNFGTPEPKFQIVNQTFEDKNYIVFAVQTFTTTPIFCKNSFILGKLEDGAIYIRTDKPETKKITEPHEMADLYELGMDREIEHMTPRIKALLAVLGSDSKNTEVTKSDADKFEKELEDVKK